jgi:hypothetical protein
MRNVIVKAALIPILVSLFGLYRPKRTKGSRTSLGSSGQATNVNTAHTVVKRARIRVTKVDADSKQQDVTVDPTRRTQPDISDDQLMADSKLIASAIKMLNSKRAEQATTVSTIQDANGNRYYTMASNGTTPDARLAAESLGYNRLTGGDIKEDGASHAEQVAMNALKQRKWAEENGLADTEPYRSLPVPPITIAPHRPPCDDTPNNPQDQGCRERAENTEGVRIVG